MKELSLKETLIQCMPITNSVKPIGSWFKQTTTETTPIPFMTPEESQLRTEFGNEDPPILKKMT